MSRERMWADLQPVVRDFLFNGWRVELDPYTLIGLETKEYAFTLRAHRDDWLIEMTRAEILRDDICLMSPESDSFIRLDHKGIELSRLIPKDEAGIREWWDNQADRRRYGPEGSAEAPTRPAEDPKLAALRIRRWARETGQLDKLDALESPPGAIKGGLWTVEWMNGTRRTETSYYTRDEVMDFACKVWTNHAGEVLRLLRPDGMVEWEGDALRTALAAYETNRPKR